MHLEKQCMTPISSFFLRKWMMKTQYKFIYCNYNKSLNIFFINVFIVIQVNNWDL